MIKILIYFFVHSIIVDIFGSDLRDTMITINDKTYYTSKTNLNYLMSKLDIHNERIRKINSYVSNYNPTNNSPDPYVKGILVNVDNLNKIEYNHINEKAIRSISFDKNDYPRSIYFNKSLSKTLTKEEYEYYRRNNQIPASYVKINEEEAIKCATGLQKAIYGEVESNQFDSINISHTSAIAGQYVIYFKVKVKNDIWDSRSSEVTINANNGEINSYHGEGKSNIANFDYIPKVTKQQVLKMYQNEIDRLKADISIRKIVITKYFKAKNPLGYAWQIYGDRHDKVLGLSAMMFIDSETGEVLVNHMD